MGEFYQKKLSKKTPGQKIRDYFNTPRWRALNKKQENQYGRRMG